MNFRTFLILALIGMFAYHVIDIRSNMVGNFAKHHAQIEAVLAQ